MMLTLRGRYVGEAHLDLTHAIGYNHSRLTQYVIRVTLNQLKVES
jgi:hypothetical protein